MIEIEEMHRRFDNSPYALQLGMKVVEISHGYSRIELELKQEFLNWDNMIHGGVIVSLLDQAFGSATNTLENVHVAGQLNVHFMGAASVGETIYAECKVLHAGRRMGTSEMTVTSSKGKVIARSTGTTICTGPRT